MQTTVGSQGAGAKAAGQAAVTELPVPRTAAEVSALLAKRSELSTQLQSAASRSRSLTNQIEQAPNEAKPVLVENLKAVNSRLITLETELGNVGWQLANIPPGVARVSIAPPPLPRNVMTSEQITAISIVGIIFVLAPISLAIARLVWRRAIGRVHTAADTDAAQRLKRMEHAVDAMAIEVERISEGQRFLTQIFAKEARPEALGARAGEAEPVERSSRGLS